jgi:hypothetical protein
MSLYKHIIIFLITGKAKFVPVIFLTEHHAMGADWGMEV